MSLAGKNVLVVGGSSGIGLSIVNRLLQQNAIVFNASRKASAAWLPGVTHIETDVLNDFSHLSAQLPAELHGLVYCVGSITLKPFNRLTAEDFLNDYRLNVIGAAGAVQQSLNSLKNAGTSSVVLFSSVAATAGMGFHASIAAAKSGVEGLAKALAAEFASKQIRVNVIAPSLTDTPLAQALLNTAEKKEAAAKRHPLGKFGTAADLSAAACFLLSDDSTWITGQVLGIDGGLSVIKSV